MYDAGIGTRDQDTVFHLRNKFGHIKQCTVYEQYSSCFVNAIK